MTILLGSSKGMAASKVYTSASVSTAVQSTIETDAKNAESETGHKGQCAVCDFACERR